MPAFVRFHIACQPEYGALMQFTIKWNDFRLWEKTTGRSFADLTTAMADVISDVAYWVARNRLDYRGTLDEFLSGDFGFEEESADPPTQPAPSTGSSLSSPSPPASAPGNGPASGSGP